MNQGVQRPVVLLLAVALLLHFGGCATRPAASGYPTPVPESEEIALPPPRLTGEKALEQAIASRRSVREFTGEALSQSEISQLFWAAQGITDER